MNTWSKSCFRVVARVKSCGQKLIALQSIAMYCKISLQLICCMLFCLLLDTAMYCYILLCPPYSKKGHSETLLSTCIAHSDSADLLLSDNASDWLSGDFHKKNQ